MKKLVNDPQQVVREMLEGLCDLDPHLALLQSEAVVVRADLAPPAPGVGHSWVTPRFDGACDAMPRPTSTTAITTLPDMCCQRSTARCSRQRCGRAALARESV